MMNLVLFGYFITTQFFSDMTNIDLRKMMFEEKMRMIEEDVVPFGFIDDASDEIARIESERFYKDENWQIPINVEY